MVLIQKPNLGSHHAEYCKFPVLEKLDSAVRCWYSSVMPLRCTVMAILVLTFCAVISCNGRNRGAKVEVELDVFSGKRNPRWELPPDQASNLLATIGSLSEVKAEAPVPGLGYRGFVLHSEARSIRIYHGLIAVDDHGVTRTFRDTTNIEAMLAADARKRGYADLVGDTPASH